VVSAHAAPRPSRSAASIASSAFSGWPCAALRAVRVPAFALEHGDARAVGRARKVAGEPAESAGLWRGDGSPSRARRAPSTTARAAARRRRRAAGRAAAGRRAPAATPAGAYEITSAGPRKAQRHRRRDRDRFAAAPRQQADEAVQPAVLDVVRRGAAGLETFWPSKCERSRYGDATAWTKSAFLRS
jgi:hypothetical protein